MVTALVKAVKLKGFFMTFWSCEDISLQKKKKGKRTKEQTKTTHILELVSCGLDSLEGNEEAEDIVSSLKDAEDAEVTENPLEGVLCQRKGKTQNQNKNKNNNKQNMKT